MNPLLHHLPAELLEHIFSFVHSSNEIINLSETCLLFHEVILSSEKISKFLKITINLSEDNLGLFAKTMAQSRRRYRNIKIIKTNERSNGYNNNNGRSPRYFAKIGPKIRHLELCYVYGNGRENNLFEYVTNRRQMDEFNQHNRIGHRRERNDPISELTNLLKDFTNLNSMKLSNVHLDRSPSNHEKLMHLSTVEVLEMKHCDSNCIELISSINQLKTFRFYDPLFWSSSRNSGIEIFENFLLKHHSLKHLSIQNMQYRLFPIDKSSNITFKLHSLSLKNVFFKDCNFVENFFLTQDELRNFEITIQNEKVRSLDEVLFYNNIIKTVFLKNKSLRTVKIDKLKYRLENCDFLGTSVNNSVRKLAFTVSSEDKDVNLFKRMIGLFPNLKEISFKSTENDDADSCKCFDSGTVLEKIESLTIVNASVRTLLNIQAEQLRHFEFSPGATGEYIDDFIGGFLHRHRHLKSLVIGNKNRLNSYFFVSYNLCTLITDFLNDLESIAIFNLGEVNKSVKLIVSALPKLKSLTISSSQYQQFTAKTKVECERMKIKIIPFDV